MTHNISGVKILVLVSNGVDEAVMSSVQRELLKTGAVIKTVGTEAGLVNSWNNNAWGLYFPVDQQISQTLGADYDALIVPSGERSIQKLSINPHAERIISSFIMAEKPMAFMGDAVELLAKTGVAKDWQVAGPAKSEAVMVEAGAIWQGTDVTAHNMLMTGDVTDVVAFVAAITTHIAGNKSQEEMKAAA